MSTAEHCPRCGSDRLTISGANGAVMTSCDRCGEQWGDVDRYYREIAEIRAERGPPWPMQGGPKAGKDSGACENQAEAQRRP